jgi:hypothetical protein
MFKFGCRGFTVGNMSRLQNGQVGF